MHNNFFRTIIVFSILFFQSAKAQTTFYDLNTIQRIEIYFSQPNWDYQMDTAKHGEENYIIADWVKINGVQYDSVGVKYKGNSSYDSTYSKNPIHIELDNVLDQSYQGITDIKLGNGYADPSAIREVLAYDILKKYMDCPRANFTQLYVNGSYIGLYSNAESIGKDFCSTHFYSSQNTFFKCNPVVIPGPTTKSNLKYLPLVDSSGYFNFYELKSDNGWNELVQLCDTVTNYPSSLENNIDIDRLLWMLAFNSVLVNLDSYTGVFCQNYYIYKDNTNRFNPIVWDLNMAFGGFPYVGSGNTSMGSLTVTNMQQLSPTFHSADPYWPLINAVMSNASYKKMYIAHARTINNENFVSNNYLATATQLQALVDTAAQADSNMFFSYTQFQNGLTTNYAVGSYTVPGISNLMNTRASYLQSNADFLLIPPAISSVTPSNSNPVINSTITITAQVTNTNSNAVYLGYRLNQQDKFTKVVMYDDGVHNDGLANDNVYGIDVAVATVQMQYYIYAENNDASTFSPERAEHEFYSVQAQIAVPLQGQVVINEFLANNQNGVTNENGAHADWIELFNTTSTPLSLFGLYLTDDFSNPAKFPFPQNSIIQPNDYLIVWADENNSTASYLHCNFKLSASGEQLMLSDGATTVIDSLTFSSQVADISKGRCPNGSGPFVSLSPPSFDTLNCSQIGIAEQENLKSITLFPNPATAYLSYTVNQPDEILSMVISNTLLQKVKRIGPSTENLIDVSDLQPGIYFITFFNKAGIQKSLRFVKLKG